MKRQRRKSTLTPEVDVESFKNAICGACLLELIDESEHQLSDSLSLSFRKPENCLHLYHKNCLEEWFKRDSSCPQCRLRVERVIEIDEKGLRLGSQTIMPVFLEDILEAEEEEEDEEEEEVEQSEVLPVRPRRRQQPRTPPRSMSQAMRRDSDKRITEQVAAEAEKMRKRLAAERSRELRQQKAILQSIDPLKVRISIIKSLRKLPYDLQTTSAAAENRTANTAPVSVPTPKKESSVRSRSGSSNSSSFIKLKPPSYERDFLSKEPPHPS